MGQHMFEFDEQLAHAVFAYCRDRLTQPVPLDFGGLSLEALPDLEGLISREGSNPEQVLEFFKDRIAQHVISCDSPGFLAFIPNAPTKNSLLFDMVVACSGLNGTSWLEAAGAVALENQALEFLAGQAAMPAGSGGAFVSGGSMGNLASLTVGRDIGRAKRPEFAPHQVRFAISQDAHSSIGTSLHVLGIEPLVVECDEHRFTRARLEAAMANDPLADNVVGVVATAGTTNAGIVDDLEGLGTFARENDLWFHVDGAYGGAALFSPSQRHLFAGIRHADTFIVDPHKWLYAPLDCCALLYRDPTTARKILAQQASYLDVLHDNEDETTSGIRRTSRSTCRVAHGGSPSGSRSSPTAFVPTKRRSRRRLPSPRPRRGSSKKWTTSSWCDRRASRSSCSVASAGTPSATSSGATSSCAIRSPS
jgi:aromatic-L-amino-acid decarboxylase